MDNTGKALKKMFDYQKFEKEPGLQGVIDDTVSTASTIRKLGEDELDLVSAGTDAHLYNDSELKKAGVIIKGIGPKRTYCTMLDGRQVDVSENVVRGMVDCYKISGGTKLTDEQLKDLIAQS